VIHEHRFTWERDGLCKLADLGTVWEKNLKCPVPLGCVVVRRSLGEEVATELESAMQKSIKKADRRKEKVTPYIREHAQIDDDAVIVSHIETFVNKFSLNMGREGAKALKMVENLADADAGGVGARLALPFHTFVEVAVPGTKFDKLTYGLSDTDARFVRPGSVLWVTLKGRKERCLALALAVHASKPGFPVKQAWPHKSRYVFSKQYLETLRFAAHYYLSSLGEALTAFWPSELEKFL
jgi:hypothetical protein